MPAASAIAPCPGLSVTRAGITFTDSLGRKHDLRAPAQKPIPLKTAAALFASGRSVVWLRREINAGHIYPVLKSSARLIEVYPAAIEDWHARKLSAA